MMLSTTRAGALLSMARAGIALSPSTAGIAFSAPAFRGRAVSAPLGAVTSVGVAAASALQKTPARRAAAAVRCRGSARRRWRHLRLLPSQHLRAPAHALARGDR